MELVLSQLIHVSGPDRERAGTVIFVHGLGGHAYDTFRRGTGKDVNADETFWPRWIADALPRTNVSTFAYDAPMLGWFGTAMTIPQRAVNLRETLLNSLRDTTGPVAFVCHSLGGIVVKQTLLMLDERKESDPAAEALLDRIRAVVFIATPHTGAYHATLLDRFRLWVWPSVAALSLVKDDPLLTQINDRYQHLAAQRKTMLFHQVFVETKHTLAGIIVTPAGGNPGLLVDPVPDDKTHLEIARPINADDLVAKGTLSLLSRALEVPIAGGLPTDRQTLKAVYRPKDESYPVRLFRAAFVAMSLTLAVGIPVLSYDLWRQNQLKDELIKQQQEKIEAMEAVLRAQVDGPGTVSPRSVAPQIATLAGDPKVTTEDATVAIQGVVRAWQDLNSSLSTSLPTETAELAAMRGAIRQDLLAGLVPNVESGLSNASLFAVGQDPAVRAQVLREQGLLNWFQLNFDEAAAKLAEAAALQPPASPDWRVTLEDQIAVYTLADRLFDDPVARAEIESLHVLLGDNLATQEQFVVRNDTVMNAPPAVEGPVVGGTTPG